MTRSATIYASAAPTDPSRCRYTHRYRSRWSEGTVCIRIEFNDTDFTTALERATPRPGEVVLNTVPLPLFAPKQ
jgi:hypothetical protein